ncbi:MAG: hypothetical protein Q8K10_05965 [Methylobacter sp.]|nr:hypothetical protein [Methylobacter sp.]
MTFEIAALFGKVLVVLWGGMPEMIAINAWKKTQEYCDQNNNSSHS